jgi:hypothetical protein
MTKSKPESKTTCDEPRSRNKGLAIFITPLNPYFATPTRTLTASGSEGIHPSPRRSHKIQLASVL